MTAPQQPPHPLRCETCENNACEYWEESPHMSAGHDEQTGWRASPGVITFAVGCASHSSASQQRIEQVIKKFYDELKKSRCKESDSVSMDDVDYIYTALLQAGRK